MIYEYRVPWYDFRGSTLYRMSTVGRCAVGPDPLSKNTAPISKTKKEFPLGHEPIICDDYFFAAGIILLWTLTMKNNPFQCISDKSN